MSHVTLRPDRPLNFHVKFRKNFTAQFFRFSRLNPPCFFPLDQPVPQNRPNHGLTQSNNAIMIQGHCNIYVYVFWWQVGSGVTSLAGGVCLFVFVHWAGKRKLALVALAGSAACCLVIAVYSYVVLRPGGATDKAMPWIPLTMVVMLAFFNSLFFYIPWNWLSEMFPFR